MGWEEPLAGAVEASNLLCCSSVNKAHDYSQKRQDSAEGGASWSVGKRPGLLGFVAKHLPRAEELESIWEPGRTKSKVREGRLSTRVPWKSNSTKMWQRNTR